MCPVNEHSTNREPRAGELDALGDGVDDVELHGEALHLEVVLAALLHVDQRLRAGLGIGRRGCVIMLNFIISSAPANTGWSICSGKRLCRHQIKFKVTSTMTELQIWS